MREIKFRAWEKDKKEMHYNPRIGHSNPTVNTFFECDSAWYIPMQYTGMRDKNDREIYEGDIVSGQTSGPIEWAYGGWCVAGENPYLDLYADLNREVIGNIYENPELLEAK